MINNETVSNGLQNNRENNNKSKNNEHEPKENAGFEIKKMRQGMSYTCKEKTIILNVFKYFRYHYPEKCVTDIVRRTAKATGCSEKSVFQFRKEESSAEGFKEPSKTKVRKHININSRYIKYDQTERNKIRNIIYDLQYRNIIPSLNTILKRVNADDQMPNFSLMTLRRLLLDMGFSYQKNGNKTVLVENPDARFVNVPNSNQNESATNYISPLPPPVLPSHNLAQIHSMSKQVPPPHPPMHVLPQHHNGPVLQPPANMLHKQMHMMPPPPPPPITPWMHDLIKQRQ